MYSDPQLPAIAVAPPQALAPELPPRTAVVRYAAGVLLLAAVYYAAGRASLAVQFDGPVAALWLPTGLGAAVLYLGGLRWWPGLLLGDLALADPAQPLGSALGITAGNLADMVAIALLLRALVGARSALGEREHVAGLLLAIVAGAAITATVAVLSLRAGSVVTAGDVPTFWRSWFLADACGSLVVVPVLLAWAPPHRAALSPYDVAEGAVMLLAVATLTALALSAGEPVTYLVFPALIWAALRFGQRGGTLAVAVSAVLTVTITARELGPFVEHAITASRLGTQLDVVVAATTTLFLAAIASERRQAAQQLTAARNRLVTATDAERRRIERDLHDGAQQRLVALAIRLGAVADGTADVPAPTRRALGELGVLVDDAIDDVRSIAAGIYPAALDHGGLAAALGDLAATAPTPTWLEIDPTARYRPHVEAAVYFCCSEALQNAAKHARGLSGVEISVRRARGLRFEVRDDGSGFAPGAVPGGDGLANMRERVEAVGGTLVLRSGPGQGTSVLGEIPHP